MKYMSFNSSCAFAGVANMLEQYGFDTDDRTIALGMKLPYMFAYEKGAFLAGPMLQSAEWFNLYLNPIGFELHEEEVTAETIASCLLSYGTAMLGLRTSDKDKHAFVFVRFEDGKFVFINNKWQNTNVPEYAAFTGAELSERIEKPAVAAVLNKIEPKSVNFKEKLKSSIYVLRRNYSEIKAIGAQKCSIETLRGKMNVLFRPLLLDGITMLRLIGRDELADRFTQIQSMFLQVLRMDKDSAVCLCDFLPMEEFAEAVENYARLIEGQSA